MPALTIFMKTWLTPINAEQKISKKAPKASIWSLRSIFSHNSFIPNRQVLADINNPLIRKALTISIKPVKNDL